MMLRDRMVYAGIQNSKKMARLSWFQRDFFRGLLHVADDYGRFEADVEMLRTVLYVRQLSKVTMRDVQDALLRCAAAEVGLVKLYTVEGRGYGKVVNFRQTLQKRRALYPDEGNALPEPDLFGAGPEPPPERRKEGKAPQPPAEAGGSIFPSPLPEAARFARRRSPERTLKAAQDELAAVEQRMTEILYPGGCAHKVTPIGPKREEFDRLSHRRNQLLNTVSAARAKMKEET